MNETTTGTANATQYSEFVWRRLEEPMRLLGWDLPWQMWLVSLGLVLTAALIYVVLMYRKDALGVGPWWATLLGLLRLCVYGILALVFLLPARQSYVETRSESKVVVVWDVSSSMHTSDEIPTGRTNEKLTTRMDRVWEFLRDPKVNFLTSLERKNPVTVYRLGSKLDEDYLHFAGGRVWTREEKEKPPRDEEGAVIVPEQKPLAEEYWKAWLNPAAKVESGIGMSRMEEDRLAKLADRNARLVKEGLMRGTNLGDSLSSIINKEMSNRVQGIVVFTDGRNTEGSPNAFTDLSNRARSARIPLFVVAVGEDRQKVKIDIVDTRTSPQIQPEDRFRAVTEITGEGLPGQNLDVTLEITHVRTVKVKTKDKEGKVVEEDREELLPIELVERENPDNPKAPRAKITLGNRLQLKPPTPAALDKATPPRAEIEWQLDAAALAAAAKVDLNDEKYRGKKWEVGETKDDSELKYQITVPRDKREVPPILDPKDPKYKAPGELERHKKFHVGERVGMKVIKKPLRVLLLAAAANRDYQFVRTLLVREMEKKRLELAIHLQLPPGQEKRRTGVVQDVPPDRLLGSFPDSFKKKKGDLYDLQSYDCIVAFDPDWNQISPEQIKLVKNWVEQGGGLVVVGGYINTVELIRPRDGADADRFQPILDLLPVVLDDRRDYAERKTDDPFALDFSGATREMEFLKLDEALDDTRFAEDWQAFFFGTEKDRKEKPIRGFYNFYPVRQAKVGSIVVARFTDPSTKLKDNTLHPYIVVNPETQPRVVWLGSAETWRLREYREAYHERFWTKLVQYAASKSKGGVISSIRAEASRTIPQNRYFTLPAKIDGPDGGPLSRTVKPEITLKMPAGVSEKEIRQPIIMTPRPGASDGWFTGQFLVKSPGEYEYTIRVPKQPGQDNDMTATGKFTVTEANPELDNTRPDLDRMYRMASEADDVLRRMNDSDRAELKRRLQRPARVETTPTSPTSEQDKVEIRDDRMRLYFDLKNAGLIPSCMIQDIQKQTSRGPHHDLWDDGVTLYEYPPPEDPSKPARKPIKVSYVLLLVVGLLSAEWLIRKLLRLA